MALIRSIRGGSAGLNEEDRLKMANLHKANALCELVDNQPTAFDVEKVVADLEQLKLDGACECWDGDMGEEQSLRKRLLKLRAIEVPLQYPKLLENLYIAKKSTVGTAC